MIELSVDAEETAVQWRAGNPPSRYLPREIAVFDAHCARVFIDEANEAVYLPYGLDVFGKLAVLSKSLKDKIAARLALIPQRLPFIDDFTKTTTAGQFVSTLTAATDIARLEILARLDEKTSRPTPGTAKASSPRLNHIHRSYAPPNFGVSRTDLSRFQRRPQLLQTPYPPKPWRISRR